MGKILKYKDWSILTTGYFQDDTVKELFDHIRSDKFEHGEYLKEHHRSIVSRFSFKNRDLVLKIPLEKNKRPWIRFTTLYRDGEAYRNIYAMELLASLEIPSTVPVLAAEMQNRGMVTDSFLVYEYLDGTSCSDHAEWYPLVVERLASMHDKGILHGDSQIQNFLQTGGMISVIDSSPSTIRNHYQVAYEYVYLKKSCPDIEPYFGDIVQTFWYRFAAKKLAFDRNLAHTRRRIKRLLGIKLKEG